jgi:hypothetical protein
VHEITAGTEVTFDCGTASYASGIDAVLRCCLNNNQQQLLQIKQRLEQQEEKLRAIKTLTEQQQSEALDPHDLPVCPVPAGNNVPAGKLHKSLMSQLLAALATCRKLPASCAQRSELDKLLQQAVTLAHEAVVVWSSAAAAGQQQLLASGEPAMKDAAAAAVHKEVDAGDASVLTGASSTPSAPRTPTFGGFLEVAPTAHDSNAQQQGQLTAGFAAHTAAGDAAPFGIELSSFGSAGSCESLSAAAVRPSRWSHSISAAVEVPAEWQQVRGEAEDCQGPQQQQQQLLPPPPERETSLLDDEFTEQQQQQGLGCSAGQHAGGCCEEGGVLGEGGEVCAGSLQANIQPLVRQLIR